MKLKLLMSKAQRKAQQAFTLLELLIVVAILAIIGGALIVAYDGLQSQAAKATATNSIAAIDQAVRNYTAFYNTAPDELDSLIAATPTVGTGGAVSAVTAPALFGTDGTDGDLADGTDAGGLGEKLGGKLETFTLTKSAADALKAAGIRTLRYIDLAGNNQTGGQLTIQAVGGGSAFVGPLGKMDIPNMAFDAPRPGAETDNRNRGRGFPFVFGTGSPVARWKAGSGSIDNIKVGAGPEDILIAFGLGNNATIIGGGDETSVGNVTLAAAPFYGDVKKNEYSRYVLLYNVGSATSPRAKAKLQAVVDARGDFLDEEYAETTGQKQ